MWEGEGSQLQEDEDGELNPPSDLASPCLALLSAHSLIRSRRVKRRILRRGSGTKGWL